MSDTIIDRLVGEYGTDNLIFLMPCRPLCLDFSYLPLPVTFESNSLLVVENVQFRIAPASSKLSYLGRVAFYPITKGFGVQHFYVSDLLSLMREDPSSWRVGYIDANEYFQLIPIQPLCNESLS